MTKYSLPYPLPLKNPHSPFRNFNYIRPIQIIGGNTDLRNYQVKIVLTKYNFPLEKCKVDGSDIRFRDETGESLSYWIQSWDSDEAIIWCKIPYIPANRNKFIWVIYGNPSATSVSSGPATFEFFDDFVYKGEWSPYSGNPVLSPESGEEGATFVSVWKESETYHMYYSYWSSGGSLQIGHATSSDGKNWTKDDANNPVLSPGSATWENTHVLCPWVWKENDVWYMIYAGRGTSSEAIGLATSSDGINWTKEESNPILEGSGSGWEGNSVENFGVIKVGSTYYLWYESGASGERQTGLATSTDLLNWVKDSNNPIFTGGRFCPSQFKYGDYFYYLTPHYTSGTDYAEIELYRDTNPTFYPDDREFIKIIRSCPASGWDSHDLDTPFVLTHDIYKNSFPNNELWCYYAGESGNIWQTGLMIETDIDLALKKSLEKWFIRQGDISVSDSLLHLQGTTGTRGLIDGRGGVSVGAAIHVRAKYLQLDARTTHFCSMRKSNDDNYMVDIYERYSTGKPASVTMNAGIYSRTDWDSINTPLNWHIYKITWTASEVKYYQDDILKVTHTDNIPTTDLVARFTEGTVSGGNIDIDWVFIRKYTDPEPIVIV